MVQKIQRPRLAKADIDKKLSSRAQKLATLRRVVRDESGRALKPCCQNAHFARRSRPLRDRFVGTYWAHLRSRA